MVVKFETETLQNNTWDGLTATIYEVEGDERSLIPLDRASCKITFRYGSEEGDLAFILTTENNDILVEDPGNITILPLMINAEPGTYVGDLQVTRNNRTDTYVRVKLKVKASTND